MRFVLAFIMIASFVVFAGCSAAEPEAASKATADAPEKTPARETPFKSAEDFDLADVAAIHEMRDRWVAAFDVGNPVPVEFMFTSDAVFSLPDGLELAGTGQEPSAQQVFHRFTSKLEFDERSRFVTDGGDPRKTEKLPWVSYYAGYTLTLTPKKGGQPLQTRGQFMTRFHRQPDASLKVIRGPKLGERAPDFTLNLMKGSGKVQLSTLRGKPTVLIFGSYT
jgi:ketosteroid isomerase-like protein